VREESIFILRAKPEIAETAARLLYLTMRPLTEYWLGVDDTELALRALCRMFASAHNLFSHEFAEYAKVDGNVAGLVLDYPARTMTRLEPPTLLQYLGTMGVLNTLRMVRRSFPLHGIAEATPDQYFLAHIAVLPEYEGRGLGRLMLQRAEDRARAGGFHRITLTVDVDNSRAAKMYRRAGWEITGTAQIEDLKRRFDYHGYHQMTKKLV
jgi:ribosomal protein S18 acetylase RimI-like enzyme